MAKVMIWKIGIALLARAQSVAGGVLLAILISRKTGAEGLGIYTILFSLSSLLAMIVKFGHDHAIIKLLASKQAGNNGRYVAKTFLIMLLARALLPALLLSVIVVVVWKSWIYALFCVGLTIFTVFSTFYSAILRAEGRFYVSSFFDLGGIAIFSAGTILIFDFLVGVNVEAVLMLVLLSTFAVIFFPAALILKVRRPADLNDRELVELTQLSNDLAKHVGISQVATYVFQNSPILILGGWYGSEQVGLFRAAERLSQVVGFPLLALGAIAPRYFAKAGGEKKKSKLEAYFLILRRASAFCAIPIAATLILFPGYALSIFGPDFTSGASVLIMLVIGQCANAVSGPVGALLNMTGAEKSYKNIMLFVGGAGVVLTILAAPICGLLGVASVVAASLIVQNLLSLVLAKKQIKSFG